MLINISTTLSKDWPTDQRDAAVKDYQSVVDLPLEVNPFLLAKTTDIQAAARQVAESVRRMVPVTGLNAAMRRPIMDATVIVELPGALGYHTVNEILARGYPVVAQFQRRCKEGGTQFGGFVLYTNSVTRL